MDVSDIILEICQYFNVKELMCVSKINKLFNHTSYKLINNIINGKINPNQYFNMAGFSMDNFNYPINCLYDNEGDWSINNKDYNKINIIDINIEEIYFYQNGENDEMQWIIIGKSSDYFIYFTAGCDYTGFDCQGGGELCYSKEWSILWNMYISDCDRKLMLKHYGYQIFKLT